MSVDESFLWATPNYFVGLSRSLDPADRIRSVSGEDRPAGSSGLIWNSEWSRRVLERGHQCALLALVEASSSECIVIRTLVFNPQTQDCCSSLRSSNVRKERKKKGKTSGPFYMRWCGVLGNECSCRVSRSTPSCKTNVKQTVDVVVLLSCTTISNCARVCVREREREERVTLLAAPNATLLHF